MPDIRSPEDLEKWLEGRPLEWAPAIAARCALRVFPLVFTVLDVPDSRLGLPSKQGLILQSFRANFISWAARRYRAQEMIAYAASAADASADASAADTSASAGAAYAAAYASADASASASADASVARASAASAASASSVAASAARTSAASAAKVWESISADCGWLESAGSPPALIDQLLWPVDRRGYPRYKANLPPWARAPLNGFAKSSKDTSWELIVDWYRTIIANTHSVPKSPFGKKIDIAIATQPDEFWAVTQTRTADQIMDEVAQIAGWKTGDDATQTMRDFIIRILDESGRPLNVSEIVERFAAAGYASRDYSIRGRLNELVSEKRILRVSRGIYAAVGWQADVKTKSSLAAIPIPPSQGHGPHLGVKNGQIVFAPVSNSAQPGTDLARVERYLPLVREALGAFLGATPPVPEGGNDPYQREKRMAARYLEASSGDALNMDFDLLFGVGTSLMNRLAADAKRSLESDLAPLSDAQRLALEDFQANHGPMIVATAAGAEAVADAEKVIRNPDEERILRETIVAFMEAVKAEQGLAPPKVSELLHDAAMEMGTGHQAERSFRFGQGAARNTAIVLTSVGVMTALPVVGLALGGPIISGVGLILSCIFWEATKKSKSFEKATRPIADLIDGLSELEREKLDEMIETGTSERFARFTLKEEARLRAIAGDRPEFEWLHKQLDYLKANYKPKP